MSWYGLPMRPGSRLIGAPTPSALDAELPSDLFLKEFQAIVYLLSAQ